MLQPPLLTKEEAGLRVSLKAKEHLFSSLILMYTLSVRTAAISVLEVKTSRLKSILSQAPID